MPPALLVLILMPSFAVGGEPDPPRAAAVKIRIGGSGEHGPAKSYDQIDHSNYDALLQEFVDDEGMVRYQAWKHDSEALHRLYTYLLRLGRVDMQDPNASRAGELAFYINAYNALALWGILHEYPTASIQQHNGKKSSYKIFGDLELFVDGDYLSLNAIEHDILRTLDEPRIHFAIVCAAKGCPKLHNEAYVTDRLDQQLADNALDFFSKKKRFRICPRSNTIKISPILKWFGKDFGENDTELLIAIAPYVPDAARPWLLANLCSKIKFLGYDWSLNDQCPTASVRLGGARYSVYAHLEPCIRRIRSAFGAKEEDADASATKDDKESNEEGPVPASLPGASSAHRDLSAHPAPKATIVPPGPFTRTVRETAAPPRAVPALPEPPRLVPIVPDPVP